MGNRKLRTNCRTTKKNYARFESFESRVPFAVDLADWLPIDTSSPILLESDLNSLPAEWIEYEFGPTVLFEPSALTPVSYESPDLIAGQAWAPTQLAENVDLIAFDTFDTFDTFDAFDTFDTFDAFDTYDSSDAFDTSDAIDTWSENDLVLTEIGRIGIELALSDPSDYLSAVPLGWSSPANVLLIGPSSIVFSTSILDDFAIGSQELASFQYQIVGNAPSLNQSTSHNVSTNQFLSPFHFVDMTTSSQLPETRPELASRDTLGTSAEWTRVYPSSRDLQTSLRSLAPSISAPLQSSKSDSHLRLGTLENPPSIDLELNAQLSIGQFSPSEGRDWMSRYHFGTSSASMESGNADPQQVAVAKLMLPVGMLPIGNEIVTGDATAIQCGETNEHFVVQTALICESLEQHLYPHEFDTADLTNDWKDLGETPSDRSIDLFAAGLVLLALQTRFGPRDIEEDEANSSCAPSGSTMKATYL